MSKRSQLQLFPRKRLRALAGWNVSPLFAHLPAISVGARPLLVVDNTARRRAAAYAPTQLTFDFRSDENSVVRLIPRTRSAFLGMEATSFFRRSPSLYRVAMKYQRRGIVFLGDFLRLPLIDILTAVKNRELFGMLEKELARVDLAVGDRFSWWKRPVAD